MIYLVSNQDKEFSSEFKRISVEESLELLTPCKLLQYDSETSGRDSRLDTLLCIQFGNDAINTQVVVDVTSVDIQKYKELLESHWLIGQNIKFDLEFLYSVGIIPRMVWDTMITEQLLFLGYPAGQISYSLKSIAMRRLGVDIDKTVRGEIIWRGLDDNVIKYAAGDVLWLEKIVAIQKKELQETNRIKAAKLENAFTPAIAYLEWCGIKLDEKKWREKMKNDQECLEKAKKELDNWFISNPIFNSNLHNHYVDYQGDLFADDFSPKCTLNWSSSKQVTEVAKILGFNTEVKDKKTGETKDSVLEKTMITQKGVCDEFLDKYFAYQEKSKVVSSFGQSQLNMINPITGRCHTTYRAIGAASGRMSCGSRQPNTTLAKFKKIPESECTYCNFQQLPADEPTRSSFVAEEGNLFCSCDYSAAEARLGADIYQDPEMLKEYTEGAGDSHSLYAWLVFRKECEECGCTSAKDVKKLAPQWRKKVKQVEFAYQFGAAAPTIAQSAGCSREQAQKYIDDLNAGFKGMTAFAQKGSEFVRTHGYIVMCQYTGHRMIWWDFDKWRKEQDDYENFYLNPPNKREHFSAGSKWDRMARNSPTQGTCAIILKEAVTNFFNWIVDNNLFDKVKIVALVHDEVNIEFPEIMPEVPIKLKECMETAAAKYCKSLPIPASPEIGSHWIH